MSKKENQDSNITEDEFREKISLFIMKNFPQIEGHGGNSDIIEADPNTGIVRIVLSGACSGCGISPMTTEAIKRRMKNEIKEAKEIHVSTGMDDLNNTMQPAFSRKSDKESDEKENKYDAPF